MGKQTTEEECKSQALQAKAGNPAQLCASSAKHCFYCLELGSDQAQVVRKGWFAVLCIKSPRCHDVSFLLHSFPPPSHRLGLASPQWSPCWPSPPSQLLFFAGWGFLVLLAFPSVLGGWGFVCCLQHPIRSGVRFRVLAHRTQLGRLGGSRCRPVGLGSSNKIPVPSH